MICQRCKSQRVANIFAKCSDMCNVEMGDKYIEGYVPRDLNIGGGDYIRFSVCLDCGQHQGTFPLQESKLELM